MFSSPQANTTTTQITRVIYFNLIFSFNYISNCSCIYIIYTNEQGEQTYKTIPLGTQPLCGILASDDEVLLIGGYNEMILYFSIAEENLLDP